MASSSSWLGGAGEVESAPSTPGERPSGDLGDTGFIKHKVRERRGGRATCARSPPPSHL